MSHLEDKLVCLDYCTHKCPCFLARSGKCPECSILNGDCVCHCNWTGFCLLLELQWNRGSFLDSIRTERAKVACLRPIGKGVLELVVLLEESSVLKVNPGIYVSVLVRFDSHPSVWCMGVCSHLGDNQAMHFVVPEYYFAHINRQVLSNGECTLVSWGKGAVDPGTLLRSAMKESVIVGTGLNQVMTLQIVQWLQEMGHSNVQVWLSRNAPAVQFVIVQFRTLGIQPRLFSSESALFSSLQAFLNSSFVDHIFCACNTANCGKIIEIASKTVCRPLLSFFDVLIAHSIAKQLQRRIIRK